MKCTNSYEGEYTIKYQKHIPNSIGAKYCELTIDLLYFLLFSKAKIVLINLSHGFYENSQICWICKQELNTDKVRDHSHVMGKFRGASHSKCNINLRLPKKPSIIFHNLQGYDGHIIFKKLKILT